MTKTILITGATDGIGKHLAKKLASEGHRLLLHGRNPQKLATALAEVTALSPHGHVSAYQADFTKMSDVFHFVSEIQKDVPTLDVLINNAGLYAGSARQVTEEGVEVTFMLSVLVPYLLTMAFQPLLERAEAGRVINTSSFMHHFAKPADLDFGFEQTYSPGLAYNNSKLYTIWLTRYLAQTYRRSGLKTTINAYHPGLIATNLGNDTSDAKVQKSLFGRLMKSLSKSLDQGIETGYYLALSNLVSAETGAYFDGKKKAWVSDKGYSSEKGQRLLAYCDQKIAQARKAYQ